MVPSVECLSVLTLGSISVISILWYNRRSLPFLLTLNRRLSNRKNLQRASFSTSDWMWTRENAEEESFGLPQKKLVLVMVGLPARGKSFVVQKIIRYIEWIGYPTRIFNVGDYRRQIGRAGESSEFFSSADENASKLREQLAMTVLDDLLNWLTQQQGQVAVFDATNTTKARRQAVLEKCNKFCGIKVMFLENICDDEVLLKENYLRKLKNDDYKTMDPEKALSDFKSRVVQYEKVYETVEDTENDNEVCYVKVFNAGQKIQARFCQGFLQSQIVSLVQNIHLKPRKIWLIQPGCSITKERNILGLDSELSEDGIREAKLLGKAMSKLAKNGLIDVWISAMKRSKQAIEFIPKEMIKRTVRTSLLNELGGGDFEGFTSKEIQSHFHEQFEARLRNKLRYRYPGVGGESYLDVISRLRPFIIEFERKKHDILIVCHEAVLRCLLGYFQGVEAENVPYVDALKRTIFELSPHRDGCDIKTIELTEFA